MKILFIGDYSRVHLSLAEGLKMLGHEAIVASDGDGMKNYPRDIDLTRKSSGLIDTISALIDTNKKFNQFKGYDVVQLINPCFITLSTGVNSRYFDRLKKNNKKIVLGAFGDDSYWVRACMENKIFEYSEFYANGKPTKLSFNAGLISKWVDSSREKLNKKIAAECNGIVACLYEYYVSYKPYFADKLRYIPLPVNTEEIEYQPILEVPQKINFFIGINRDRKEYKGTDTMESALKHIKEKYPDEVEIIRVESVPYDEYKRLMSSAHVVLDQLYSHSPAMNALLAMAQGKIVVGGGEEHTYDLMGEKELRPIVNIQPNEEDVFNKLEWIVKNKERIPQLSREGHEFVLKNHNTIKVAQQYLDFWNSI